MVRVIYEKLTVAQLFNELLAAYTCRTRSFNTFQYVFAKARHMSAILIRLNQTLLSYTFIFLFHLRLSIPVDKNICHKDVM